MNKNAVIIFILIGILAISGAGYLGFATTEQPTPTPTPQTVSAEMCDVEQTVTAPGNLVNVNEADVNMPATGKLSAVNVRVGDRVRAGQTLAELDPLTTSQAQLDLLEAQEELEKIQRQRTALDYPRATDDFIRDYRRRVKAARDTIDSLDDSLRNTDDPMMRSQILAALTNARTELKTLESNLNWYTSNPSEQDIVQADSELALAQAKYDVAKAVLGSLEIKAPFNGIVFEVGAEPGQTYQAESVLFKIGDPKALEVKANITEEDYPIVSVGQVVEVFFDARADVTVTGRVDRIIPKRIEGDRPLYDIYISLDEVPDGLADGMTSDTAITIAKRERVLCLPRAAVRASSGDTTVVKVWNGVEEVSKEITIGLRGDTYVEIVSGLNEGEEVVTR